MVIGWRKSITLVILPALFTRVSSSVHNRDVLWLSGRDAERAGSQLVQASLPCCDIGHGSLISQIVTVTISGENIGAYCIDEVRVTKS
jgi:hypothetical protein